MKLPKLTLATILLTAGLMLAPQVHELLYFEHDQVLSGSWWRLLSGHLIHTDWGHWFWNMAALGVLGGYLEQNSRILWISTILAGVVSVDLLLMSGVTQVTRYCGLSGVLNTLLVMALYLYGRQTRSGWVIVAGLICLAKLILELHSGTSLLTHIRWPPFPPAHLAGTLAGAVMILTQLGLDNKSGLSKNTAIG
ncbi:MAG: rhombosortase [Candidatus Thiodiazotropha sp.]